MVLRRLIPILLFAVTASAQSPQSPAWRDALLEASHEKKPLVVFFRPEQCEPCDDFKNLSLIHPTIASRLPNVVFKTLPITEPEWDGPNPGLAIFDRTGTFRARWRVMPDTMRMSMVLDAATVIASRLERIAQLIESGSKDEADLYIGSAMLLLGRPDEARQAWARARQSSDETVRREADSAIVDLDAGERGTKPQIATGAVRVLPLPQQIVKGRQVVRTNVISAVVAAVEFSLDGKAVARVDHPPFSATLNFGSVPERHTIRAVAFDRAGREVARDERSVNEAGEAFWVRIVEPREEAVAGNVRVRLSLRVPPADKIAQVRVSWNEAERAVLRGAPWQADVTIVPGQVGILRAVAELADGRSSEDAVLINAGIVEHSDVQLVQLPVTVMGGGDARPPITPADFAVREGKKTRAVEAISTAAETPLTVGLLIDTSESMQKTLPDVQVAASRFLDSILTERDRAFVVRFDSRATLAVPPTPNREGIKRRIMALQPRGLTALYDATALGLLQFEGVKGRRAIVLLTDGLDRTSEYKAAEVGELAKRVHVPIHVIAVVPGAAAGTAAAHAPDEIDAATRHIVQSTGGTLHVLRSLSELPDVYDDIANALRSQMLVFVRTERATRENEWRAIEIGTKLSGVKVFAPSGYYAIW